MTEIEKLVRQRYCGDAGWLTLDEVADAPGWGSGRRLDLVAVGCWASNAGHSIGFEVKRSVADWRRELDQPAKREPFLDEVNEFVFVAPWKVIDPKEVPEGCGLLSVNDAGELRMRVRAKQRKASLSPAFTTALFRAALRQIMEDARAVHGFAEFRGRSLSVADLRSLASKASHHLAERERAAHLEHEAERKRRREETQQWGNVLNELYRLGAELAGDRAWGVRRDESPTKYVPAVRRAIEQLRGHSATKASELATRLRRIADEISPEAKGATA